MLDAHKDFLLATSGTDFVVQAESRRSPPHVGHGLDAPSTVDRHPAHRRALPHASTSPVLASTVTRNSRTISRRRRSRPTRPSQHTWTRYAPGGGSRSRWTRTTIPDQRPGSRLASEGLVYSRAMALMAYVSSSWNTSLSLPRDLRVFAGGHEGEFPPCPPCGFGATRDDGPASWFHPYPPSPGPPLTVTDPSPFFAATLRTSSVGARPCTDGAPTAPPLRSAQSDETRR